MNEESDLLETLASNRGRKLAYAGSCVCCLLSGSFAAFAVYTEHFEHDLGYSPSQITYISIAAETGLYLFGPVMGYVADRARLSYVGLVSFVAYPIGYMGCSWAATTGQSWVFMTFFFGVVGLACTAGFMAAFITCNRLFPKSSLLSISVPTILYGGSSLLFAKPLSIYLSSGQSLGSLYLLLGTALCVVGLTAALASCGVALPRTSTSEFQESVDSQTTFWDSKAVALFVSFVLAIGPLGTYRNNLGLLAPAKAAAYEVNLFTACGTVARLLVGVVIDSFCVRPLVLLLAIFTVLFAAQAALATNWLSTDLATVVNGTAYGSSFTLYPIIVAQLWGPAFATVWGVFTLGPALGSLAFGGTLAFALDKFTSYTPFLWLSALAVLLNLCIVANVAAPVAGARQAAGH